MPGSKSRVAFALILVVFFVFFMFSPANALACENFVLRGSPRPVGFRYAPVVAPMAFLSVDLRVPALQRPVRQ